MRKRLGLALIFAVLLTCAFGLTACAPKSVTITFEPNGGTMAETTMVAAIGDNVRLPGASGTNSVTKAGYVFDGWHYDAELTDRVGTTASQTIESIQADVTLYAKWLQEFTVTGFEAGTGYTFASSNSAKATEGKTYNFTLERDNYEFDGNPTVSYTMNGVAGSLLGTGGGEGGVFTFSIPNVNGNIVITGVTGLFRRSAPTVVNGILSGTGYTMAGPAARIGEDYNFTITVLGGFQVKSGQSLTVDYEIESGESGTATGVKGTGANANVYTFTVEAVTGEVSLDASGVAAKIEMASGYSYLVQGLKHTDVYKVAGDGAAKASAAYEFTVSPRFGYGLASDATALTAAYAIGTTAGTVNGVLQAGGDYKFTIPAADFTGLASGTVVTINSITGLDDNNINPVYDANFFDAGNWVSAEYETIRTEAIETDRIAPTYEDGVLSFNGSNHGYRIGKDTEEIHLSFEWNLSNANATADLFFFTDPNSVTQYAGNTGASNMRADAALGLTKVGSGQDWGGLPFVRSDSRDWMTNPLNGRGDHSLNDGWQRVDIVIVQVGRQKVYKVYQNGTRIDMVIDTGNPTTLCPVNFNVVGGNLVEYLDQADFLKTGPGGGNPADDYASVDATRSRPLFTMGDYFFVKTSTVTTGDAPAQFRFPVMVEDVTEDQDGYTLSGDATTAMMTDYNFSLSLKPGYFVDNGLTVSYKIGEEGTFKALTTPTPANGAWAFTIPGADITSGQIFIKVDGVAEREFTVTGLSGNIGYSVSALDRDDGKVGSGSDYWLVVEPDVAGKLPWLTYKVGDVDKGAVEFVRSNENATKFYFMIPRDEITDDITLTSGVEDEAAFTQTYADIFTMNSSYFGKLEINADDVATFAGAGDVTYYAQILSGSGEVSNSTNGIQFTSGGAGNVEIRFWFILDGKLAYYVDIEVGVINFAVDNKVVDFSALPEANWELNDDALPTLKVLDAPAEYTEAGSEWIAISTAEEFDAIRDTLDGKFYLTADIDFEGAEIAPIGTQDRGTAANDYTGTGTFRGILDGLGHTISNFTVKFDNYDSGLFAGIYGSGTIRNLALVDVTGTAGNRSGLLVGTVYGGILENIYIEGTIAPTSAGDAWATGGTVFGGSGDATSASDNTNFVTRNIVTNVTVSGTENTNRIYPIGGRMGKSTTGSANIFVVSDGLTQTALASSNADKYNNITTVFALSALEAKDFYTSITLNKATLELEFGDSETLVATGLAANAADKKIYWASSNAGVAAVSNTGVVTGVGAGTAKIYAYNELTFAVVDVTVAFPDGALPGAIDSIFSAEGWTGTAPVAEDDGIKFTAAARRTIYSDALVASILKGDSGLATLPVETVSFMVKSSGSFAVTFISTDTVVDGGSAQTNTMIFRLNGSNFEILPWVNPGGNAPAANPMRTPNNGDNGRVVGTFPAASANYVANDWNRIDIILTLDKDLEFGSGNGNNGGSIVVKIYVNGRSVLWRYNSSTNYTVDTSTSDTHATRVIDGTLYQRRGNNSGTAAVGRYGKNIGFLPASGTGNGPIFIKEI